MNPSGSLRLLVQFRRYVGGGGLLLLLVYLVFSRVLRAGIITPLTAEGSFEILTQIINFTFLLAITAIIVSIVSYSLPRLMPVSLLAPIDPEAKITLMTRVINLTFIVGMTAILFLGLAIILPRILPASVFEPIPKVEYSVAIAEMIDPFAVDPMAQVMDQVETFPGFPYYSRRSDHPSEWPGRVMRDRQALFSKYARLLARHPVGEEVLGGRDHGSTVEVLGQSSTVTQTLASLRMWFNSTLEGDAAKLESALGAGGAREFLALEQERARMREAFPNRFALLRIKNAGKIDAKNIIIELDLFGELYDYSISADPEQVRHAEYDQVSNRIVVQRAPPGYLIEIRLWYRYLSVEDRVFPDEKHFILELTQGLVINNIAVSDGRAIFTRSLIGDLEAHRLLYVGDAAKKDDYSDDLRAYFERQDASSAVEREKYAAENPSFKNVTPEWLEASERPDESVTSIWVGFKSTAGKSYHAVHVFKHPDGPYLLLSSDDRDRTDFALVRDRIASAYAGQAEDSITDRTDDISAVIQVGVPFTQRGIAEKVRGFFHEAFNDAVIEAVHYSLPQ